MEYLQQVRHLVLTTSLYDGYHCYIDEKLGFRELK